MRVFFTILSLVYISGIFFWADSPMVSDLGTFNPYSLLHIPLYAILTFLLVCSVSALKSHRIDQRGMLKFLFPGLTALVVAIADEIHQSFIPCRDASIIDVFLDFVGIILMLLLIHQIYKNKYRISLQL